MTSVGHRAKGRDGKLAFLHEIRFRKFLKEEDQITFNGELSFARRQKVFYVMERCVFRLRSGGLELIEIIPGMNVEKDILPFMDFTPVISKCLKKMDSRVFIDARMNMREELLAEK